MCSLALVTQRFSQQTQGVDSGLGGKCSSRLSKRFVNHLTEEIKPHVEFQSRKEEGGPAPCGSCVPWLPTDAGWMCPVLNGTTFSCAAFDIQPSVDPSVGLSVASCGWVGGSNGSQCLNGAAWQCSSPADTGMSVCDSHGEPEGCVRWLLQKCLGVAGMISADKRESGYSAIQGDERKREICVLRSGAWAS